MSIKPRKRVVAVVPARYGSTRSPGKVVAEILGKPERYVMISLDTSGSMLFAGDEAPLAYLELKSIGLPESQTRDFSSDLCRLVSGELSIPEERIFIEFHGAPRHMWGWNGATF